MTTDTAARPSVTDGFVLVHRTLTDTGQRIRTVLHRTSAAEDMSGLAHVWRFYRAGLAEHHEGETDVVFPLVAARDPAFGALESSMAREHAEIDDLLGVADRAIDAATSDRVPATRRAAAEAVDALVSALDEHLAGEERWVLPRVVAVISPSEMIAIERGLLRRIAASRIAMTVAALAQTARREGLAMPPLPLPARLALPIWRRRYLRLLAGAGIDDVGGAR